jgi:hypothetical protein
VRRGVKGCTGGATLTIGPTQSLRQAGRCPRDRRGLSSPDSYTAMTGNRSDPLTSKSPNARCFPRRRSNPHRRQPNGLGPSGAVAVALAAAATARVIERACGLLLGGGIKRRRKGPYSEGRRAETGSWSMQEIGMCECRNDLEDLVGGYRVYECECECECGE